MKKRCAWVPDDTLYKDYHDTEWGRPVHDDRSLFENLILDGMQAGLSWAIILKKRQNFRAAFDNFDPEKIASYDKMKIESLLHDKGIIRNRLKIESAVKNARAYLELLKEYESFDAYVWSFVTRSPIQNAWKTIQEIPAKTKESEALSRSLLQSGFRFVGPTICYAFMQAVGMVNDHTVECFRYKELGG